MKYKNYEITRDDERNFKLIRYDDAVAGRDFLNSNKEVTRKKGEHYTREVFKGFYGSVTTALGGILNDLVGKDCEDIKDVLHQIQELKKDFTLINQ